MAFVYINHNIAIPNILWIHTVLCSQHNLSSDASYKYTICINYIKHHEALLLAMVPYGTVLLQPLQLYMLTLFWSVHMYIPAYTLPCVAYYIFNPIVYIYKYILLLLPYCSTIPTIPSGQRTSTRTIEKAILSSSIHERYTIASTNQLCITMVQGLPKAPDGTK